MQTYLESVNNLVEQFCSDLRDVSIGIQSDVVDLLAKQVDEMECSDMGPPKVLKDIAEQRGDSLDKADFNTLVLFYELFAGSVNFCYWYGAYDVRPTGGGASTMYKCLDDAFSSVLRDGNGGSVAESFKDNLIRARMPLLEERLRYVNEVGNSESYLTPWLYLSESLQEFLDVLLIHCPSFGKDMFLKRAFLLAHMMNRRIGLYSSFIEQVPVPADYQIPKMLEHFGVLKYSDDLHDTIWEGRLIPPGSRQECEIRASTMMACKMLAEKIGCTQGDIDTVLWYNRKSCSNPFHLTITTDY